jgi:hypothetical protein
MVSCDDASEWWLKVETRLSSKCRKGLRYERAFLTVDYKDLCSGRYVFDGLMVWVGGAAQQRKKDLQGEEVWQQRCLL